MKSVFKYALAATALVGFMSACGGNDEPNNPVNPDKPATPTAPAASTSLIYEANPLFFASDNSLAAIQARLDKIDDLEADVLWLMPIYAQGQKNAIGSPYCVKDYKAINPKYGDMAALKNLVNAAHADGMIVILDWVANHTAWDNVWISEHPDWFTKKANGDIVSPPGMGWNDVADLNYDNVEMRRAMIDAMLYWVKQADVDGFRCDYAEGVPNSFWKEAIRSIREAKPKAFMLAEASDFKLYDADFDMIYDWTYCTDLQAFYNGKSTFDKFVEKTLNRDKTVPAGKQLLRYVVNHDVISEKSPQQMYGSPEAMPGAFVITSFLSQVPMIYSGMEAGFDNRTAFINAKPLTWNAALQKKYEEICDAYKETAVARGGDLKVYSSGSKGVIFGHTNGDKTVLVAVNPTGNAVQVKVPIAFVGDKMEELISDTDLAMPSAVSLDAYGYKIFSK